MGEHTRLMSRILWFTANQIKCTYTSDVQNPLIHCKSDQAKDRSHKQTSSDMKEIVLEGMKLGEVMLVAYEIKKPRAVLMPCLCQEYQSQKLLSHLIM